MVDCVREMTSKKICRYDEYGSCEHLILLLLFVVCLQYVCLLVMMLTDSVLSLFGRGYTPLITVNTHIHTWCILI